MEPSRVRVRNCREGCVGTKSQNTAGKKCSHLGQPLAVTGGCSAECSNAFSGPSMSISTTED